LFRKEDNVLDQRRVKGLKWREKYEKEAFHLVQRVGSNFARSKVTACVFEGFQRFYAFSHFTNSCLMKSRSSADLPTGLDNAAQQTAEGTRTSSADDNDV